MNISNLLKKLGDLGLKSRPLNDENINLRVKLSRLLFDVRDIRDDLFDH